MYVYLSVYCIVVFCIVMRVFFETLGTKDTWLWGLEGVISEDVRHRAFPTPNSPPPGAMDIYKPTNDPVGYVQATSPQQPSGYPTLAAVSRVSILCDLLKTL